jgi:hypothetical protein
MVYSWLGDMTHSVRWTIVSLLLYCTFLVRFFLPLYLLGTAHFCCKLTLSTNSRSQTLLYRIFAYVTCRDVNTNHSCGTAHHHTVSSILVSPPNDRRKHTPLLSTRGWANCGVDRGPTVLRLAPPFSQPFVLRVAFRSIQLACSRQALIDLRRNKVETRVYISGTTVREASPGITAIVARRRGMSSKGARARLSIWRIVRLLLSGTGSMLPTAHHNFDASSRIQNESAGGDPFV